MATSQGGASVKISWVQGRGNGEAGVRGRWNSFCIICAHWEFGRHIDKCPRCHAAMYFWIPTEDLKFLRRGYGARRTTGWVL